VCTDQLFSIKSMKIRPSFSGSLSTGFQVCRFRNQILDYASLISAGPYSNTIFHGLRACSITAVNCTSNPFNEGPCLSMALLIRVTPERGLRLSDRPYSYSPSMLYCLVGQHNLQPCSVQVSQWPALSPYCVNAYNAC